MTKIYFVRHAQPDFAHINDGTRPLTAEGMEDRKIVLETLKDKNIDAFYCSPYLRSIQTIEDVLVDDIKFVQGNRVITLRGNVIPIVMLEEVLDVKKDNTGVQSYTVVIVSKGDKTIGLVVDSLIGQQEIVIKSLGKLINVDNVISGATVLGDGEVALILDVNTLV